jgi:hypothetical protein
MRTLILTFFAVIISAVSSAQTDSTLTNSELDVIFIGETEKVEGRTKVLHAEPLFIDLIRDLGARKGEKEWNFGLGLVDNLEYDSYEMLVEYEWAPIDRLGLEVEIPFTYFARQSRNGDSKKRSNRLESIKLAGQYTFLVSSVTKTSLALGYINELEFSDLDQFGSPLFTGNLVNPFLVGAKRWGNNFHTLVYMGGRFLREFDTNHWHRAAEWHTNLHYMIPGTRNFIGVEFNKYLHEGGDFDMTIRPQMRVGFADNFLIGIVAGLPMVRENERLSMFTRVIWEPGHKH